MLEQYDLEFEERIKGAIKLQPQYHELALKVRSSLPPKEYEELIDGLFRLQDFHQKQLDGKSLQF